MASPDPEPAVPAGAAGSAGRAGVHESFPSPTSAAQTNMSAIKVADDYCWKTKASKVASMS